MKCLLFGLGQAGMAALGYLHERGAEIVGVYSRSSHVGEDVGLLSGDGASGQTVQAVSDFVPRKGMADIALFFTTSYVTDLLEDPRRCLEQGINVLTIAEQALYPWGFAPDVCAELDRVARDNGCTLVATGVNDTVMCHLPAIAAGLAPQAKRIAIEIAGNFGALGPATLQALPIGLTRAEYDAAMAGQGEEDGHATSTCAQVAEALIAMAGLDLERLDMAVEPIFTATPIEVPTIGRTIDAGLTSGILEIARATAVDGTQVEIRLYGKLFEPHDEEYLTVAIDGPVPVRMDVRPLPSIQTTAAIAVGRAPDVVAAPPGFVTINRLPTAILRTRSSYA